MRPEAAPWLTFANEDLRMALLARANGISNQACFHVQQCCEKILKAVLLDANVIPPRSHKMADLLPRIPTPLPLDLHDSLLSLDRFYIPTRYPDALPGGIEGGLPSEEDVIQAFKATVAFTAWVNRNGLRFSFSLPPVTE